MSNSSLVTYTKISPNKTSPRNNKIDTISIHCVVGQLTAQQVLNLSSFTRYDYNNGCSCNYAVGTDGSIGLCVEEKDRSWCTSNAANDNRAITIEVASDTKHPYKVNDTAYKALINLLVDVCKRNNIKQLLWKGDKNLIGNAAKQNMTVHRWFANKACPGDYLYNKHGEIAAEVNARLGVADKVPETKPVTPAPATSSTIKEGDVVSIKSGATYYNGTDVPDWVAAKKWIVLEVAGDRAVIDKSADGQNSICSPINVKYLTTSKSETKPETKPAAKPATKTVDELAQEVIAGKWGNGDARKIALTKAGYDYNAVQNRVNEMLEGSATTNKKTIDELAREVIRGEWGNGDERKEALIKAGYDYYAVQNRVNEILEG